MKLIKRIYFNWKFNKIRDKIKVIGDYCDINNRSVINYPESLEIGSYVYIGPGAQINALGGLSIGSGTIIGPNVVIHSANHNVLNSKYLPYDETFQFRKVSIGENVWVGGNVIIVPGTCIGEGCIVGAGCVVSGDIPPLSVVVGNPCQVIKTRNSDHYFDLKQKGMIYLKHKFTNQFFTN